MKNNIKKILTGLMVIPTLAFCFSFFVPAQQAFADDTYSGIDKGVESTKTGTEKELFGTDGYFTMIINTALFLIGAISVVMLIYGGIRYTISGGKQESVTAAKNTILYAIVGIVIALLAYAIVQFVVGQLNTA